MTLLAAWGQGSDLFTEKLLPLLVLLWAEACLCFLETSGPQQTPRPAYSPTCTYHYLCLEGSLLGSQEEQTPTFLLSSSAWAPTQRHLYSTFLPADKVPVPSCQSQRSRVFYPPPIYPSVRLLILLPIFYLYFLLPTHLCAHPSIIHPCIHPIHPPTHPPSPLSHHMPLIDASKKAIQLFLSLFSPLSPKISILF